MKSTTAIQTSKLDDDEVVSLNIESLFTKVYKTPSIDYTVNLLNFTRHAPTEINKSTFKVLLEMVSKDIIMPTHRGYFNQIDGVAMGSSVGPLLTNVFVSKYVSELRSFSEVYNRYVDDVIRTLRIVADSFCKHIARRSFKFTLEKSDDQGCIVHLNKKNQKHVDADEPWSLQKVYSMHHMTSSNWRNFKNSIIEAHNNLRNNQIPKYFIEHIINSTKSSLVSNEMVRVTTVYPTDKNSPPWCQSNMANGTRRFSKTWINYYQALLSISFPPSPEASCAHWRNSSHLFLWVAWYMP